MLNKIIETLKELPEAKGNCIYEKEMIDEATEMYNNGWDKLQDGAVIQEQGNTVAVKNGNKAVVYKMDDFRVNSGKLTGSILSTLREIDLSGKQKDSFLAQAIITKYYTIRRA